MHDPMTYYTHQRGFRLFLELTGAAFEGRYTLKISDVGDQAIRSLAYGKETWVWDKLSDVQEIVVVEKLGEMN